ncbi:MAG: helix-hairpin-helix domain-containing protein [Sulfurimicrobium sp.]|nr:helix-hairpin-helix domain-containing protein [Sulfurimicrobium sp.]MDP1706040.1 helix-hairpin-helix domain-containing protein [Sulfurimicrobium sp.]MDP2199031.1 helix-hairpin-helix domain-containing protein [Sulfurimicrobium sp.]MDP3686684.1 helix-hairpin-helix domain-containing protein [Sulfurimicrobium sp.]
MKNCLIALFFYIGFLVPAWAGALVDLNNATQAQLESVTGIGQVRARAIIDYRSRIGPFKSVDDLKKVTGFGEKTIAKICSELTVGSTRPFKAKTEAGKNS